MLKPYDALLIALFCLVLSCLASSSSPFVWISIGIRIESQWQITVCQQ